MKKLTYIFTILLSLFLLACSEPVSPEQQLRAWVIQMEDAVTEKDVSAIRKLVSDNYQDEAGNSKDRAMLQLALLFKRYDNIALNNTVKEVEVSGEFARLVIATNFSQSAALATLGLTDNDYLFQLTFEKDGDEWLLNYLTYESVVGVGN